jgi:hypothetical protein
MATFSGRVVGALRLDRAIFEEVEADRGATGQALLVVLLASLANGVGTIGRAGEVGFLGGVLGALVGWVIWAFLTYFIGTRLLPEAATQADMGQLLRTIGFAQAPGMLRLLGIIPFLGRFVLVACSIWILVAFIVAVRQALDYRSTGRAIAVCLIGFAAYVLVTVAIYLLLGLSISGVRMESGT